MKQPKIRIFPHRKAFLDEHYLRNWLLGTLRIDRNGDYLLGIARDLMQQNAFPRGSVALFEKSGFLVGFGIVEEEPRRLDEKKDRKEIEDGWKGRIKFIPESICAFSEEKFVSLTELRKKIKGLPEILPGTYPEVELVDFLRILQEIAAV